MSGPCSAVGLLEGRAIAGPGVMMKLFAMMSANGTNGTNGGHTKQEHIFLKGFAIRGAWNGHLCLLSRVLIFNYWGTFIFVCSMRLSAPLEFASGGKRN